MCYLCHSVIAAPWLSKLCDIVHRRPWKPGNLSSKTPITEYFLSVQQKFFFTHIFSLKYHKKPELLSLSEKKKKKGFLGNAGYRAKATQPYIL